MTICYEPKSAWDIYSEDHKAMKAMAKKYMKFLNQGKTERECVKEITERLSQAGFSENWTNDNFFTTLHGKALFAVRKGRRPLSEGFRLISAHIDSPRLDFKQNPLMESLSVGQAKTHYYGGIRKYQWLARPLALHGVVVKTDGTIVNICIGEKESDPVFTITDLLPHLAKDQEAKTINLAFEAEKMSVVLGHSPSPTKINKKDKDTKSAIKNHILEILHKKYGIVEEDLFSAEIQAVPAGPARFVGLDESLIGGYGQDDRICVYAALEAFLEAQDPEYHTCVVFWDKEEIGSEGSTGASSRFLEYCVEDMLEHWANGDMQNDKNTKNKNKTTSLREVMLASKAISADVHAAIDPSWQEVYEKQNAALIGYGPTFSKFTGSRGKYGANDAHPEFIAWLRRILAEKNIPWQMAELGKVDQGGGGTVALFLAVYGMYVIDMGPSLLSMHSPFEIASVADLYATKLAFQCFFEAGEM